MQSASFSFNFELFTFDSVTAGVGPEHGDAIKIASGTNFPCQPVFVVYLMTSHTLKQHESQKQPPNVYLRAC